MATASAVPVSTGVLSAQVPGEIRNTVFCTLIPFTPPLEREYLPLEEDILRAARDLAAY